MYLEIILPYAGLAIVAGICIKNYLHSSAEDLASDRLNKLYSLYNHSDDTSLEELIALDQHRIQ